MAIRSLHLSDRYQCLVQNLNATKLAAARTNEGSVFTVPSFAMAA